MVFKKSCPFLFQPKKEAREGALDFKLNIYHDQPKWNFKKWKAVENFEVAKIANQIDFINKDANYLIYVVTSNLVHPI